MIKFLASILMIFGFQSCDWRQERIQEKPQQEQEVSPKEKYLQRDQQMELEEKKREVNIMPVPES